MLPKDILLVICNTISGVKVIWFRDDDFKMADASLKRLADNDIIPESLH